jgi:murein DD-endopeptidase MepM/ murein hydrolase activator NlpD
VAAIDVGTGGYGVWPFGVHGSSHAADGHPGFDIEFRPGAQVRAAADGTIQHVVPDSHMSGRFTIRIDHVGGVARYATDYTNLSDIAAGIAAGVSVTRAQPLGTAGVQTQFIGTSQITWAMTHFQVNDFSRNDGLTNQNAVSPAEFFGPSALSLFNAIWRNSVYRTEFCEPFPTNSRAAGFPMSRTWTLRSGSLAPRFDVRCVSENGDYEYVLRASDGSPIEAGAIVVDATVKPLPTVELRPTSGPARLGVYDIVGGTMELNLGAPGGSRPPSLTAASVYTSTP